MELPHDLRAALTAEISSLSPGDLSAATHTLSRRYRTHGGSIATPLIRSVNEGVAYLAFRLPATFAAAAAVFREVRDRRPDAMPTTFLDVGGGSGAATWAASVAWPSLEHITVLDSDTRQLRAGQTLVRDASSSPLRTATWQPLDITTAWSVPEADITTAAYLLGELSSTDLTTFIDRLWAHTLDICVVVEPGTPRGFALIQQVGLQLAAQGAHHLAPFPVDWQCLESTDDWCHFAQRVPRTRFHRGAKDAQLGYEDEKYSYLAVSRQPGIPIAARVIRHPQVRSGHLRLVLCTSQGVKHLVVPRSHRVAYRRAKDLTWGSAISLGEAHLFHLEHL